MKRTRYRILYMIAIGIITGIFLCGCREKEISKTIVLPKEDSRESENAGIEIKNIQEYTYEGNPVEIGYLAWNQDDRGKLQILKKDKESDAFYSGTLDVASGEILEQAWIDDRYIRYVGIAPGGRYIAYVVDENFTDCSLIIYRVSDGEKSVLRRWKDGEEVLQYAWSGDGTKLFVWDHMNEYGRKEFGEWFVCRYDVESGEKKEVLLNELGISYRQVLPNQDGSMVYIAEESMESSEAYGIVEEQNSQEGLAEAMAWHRIIDMDTGEVHDLGMKSVNDICPIQYTKEGLIARDMDGTVSIYQEPDQSGVKKDLVELDYMNATLCVCAQGDHVFLVEWNSYNKYMQVSGIRIEDGKDTRRQVLYKGIAGSNAEAVINPEDNAIAIQSSEYHRDGRLGFKITVLEY